MECCKDKEREREFKDLAESLKLKVQQARTQTPEAQAKSDQVRQAEQAQEEARRLLLQGTEASRRQAIAKNEEAVRLFDSVSEHDRELFTLFDISSIYRMLSEKENERKTLDRITNSCSAYWQTIFTRGSIAAAWGFLFSYDDQLKAADYYDRAIELWRRQGDRRSEAYLLAFAAKAYNKLSEKEKALAYLERALKLYQG